jgi:predicted metalloprotease with PDZ domain
MTINSYYDSNSNSNSSKGIDYYDSGAVMMLDMQVGTKKEDGKYV